MSCKIEGTEITLTRGDTFETRVTMKYRNGTVYTPQDGDTVIFSVKENKMTTGNKEYMNKQPLILKNIPIDTMILALEPSDTKSLSFGNYKYDCEITFANGKVCTFINNANLILTPEVH